jgi:hypothetical protein
MCCVRVCVCCLVFYKFVRPNPAAELWNLIFVAQDVADSS